MKTLINGIGEYLTGDEIADAVMAYCAALVAADATALVEIPFVDPIGETERVQFVVGARTEVNAVRHADFLRPVREELLEPATTAELRRRTAALQG